MSKDVSIIIYFEEQGGHTHMRVFSGIDGKQRGKAGDLCMTNEEFAAFRNALDWQAKETGSANVDFQPEPSLLERGEQLAEIKEKGYHQR